MLAAMTGFSTTLQNIASYFSVPTLGGLYKDMTAGVKSQTLLETLRDTKIKKLMDFFSIGLPVYPDKYEESGGSEIGTQILIGGMGSDKAGNADTVGALSKVMDNVVVSPRTWTIHGFIGLNIESSMIAGYLAGFGTIPFLTNFIKVFGRDTMNSLMKRYMQYISEARRPFKFTTADGDTLPALIKSYKITNVPDNLNWVEVDLEIQEFRFIALMDDNQQEAFGGMNSLFGSPMDFARRLSRSALKTIGIKMTGLA